MISEKKIKNELKTYYKEVKKLIDNSSATELSFYTALSNLIKNSLENQEDYDVIVNPQESWGLPDLIVKAKESTIAYVECKKPDIAVDKKLLQSEQVRRYLNAFPKLCVTNFTDFAFIYKNIENDEWIINKTSLSYFFSSNSSPDDFLYEISKFFVTPSYAIHDLNHFTEILAKYTRLLDEIVKKKIKSDETFNNNALEKLFESFKNVLLDNITRIEFSDVIAQTLTYSLLLAWNSIEKSQKEVIDFDLDSTWAKIPKNLPVLKQIFSNFLIEMPDDIKYWCNEIFSFIKTSNSHDFFDIDLEKDGKDPLLYFYEDFLRFYNPEEKKARGIFYTPIPIVQFIVKTINTTLKVEFNKKGLIDEGISILDPCAGTLTFIIESIKMIYTELRNNSDLGLFKQIVKEHILQHFYAFEIMVAPYAIGHFKVSQIINSLGGNFSGGFRFKLLLTNTLETNFTVKKNFLLSLVDESEMANDVKLNKKIRVILGNPPYKIGSTNKHSTILKLLEDYKPTRLPNQKNENLEPLHDDYIKFLRFAQWKIAERDPKVGMIGFIINSNFLRGTIHRKIRYQLLTSFDRIYILDLHGDIREEIPPKGMKNQSVFGITTGVCIIFLIRTNKEKDQKELAKVYYTEVWGTSQDKLEFLVSKSYYNFFKDNDYNKPNKQVTILEPNFPYYFLFPSDIEKEKEPIWKSFASFRGDIFKDASMGVQTSRDSITIGTEQQLIRYWKEIRASTLSIDELIRKFDWEKWKGNDWTKDRIKNYLDNLKNLTEEELTNKIRRIHYRPYYFTKLFYMDGFVQATNRNRCENLRGNFDDNFAIVVIRRSRPIKGNQWNMALFTTEIPDALLVSSRGTSITCSLKIYDGERSEINLKPMFLKFLKKSWKLKSEKNSEEMESFAKNIFFYIYAILNCDVYREEWKNYLDMDLPRIPFASSKELFYKIAKKGEYIAKLHTFDKEFINNLPNDTKPHFPIEGNNDIKSYQKYNAENNEIIINNTQKITNIPPKVWNYEIGGYQVLPQILKRFKTENDSLDIERINHFFTVVQILIRTLEFQEEMNALYREVMENSLNINDSYKKLDNYLK